MMDRRMRGFTLIELLIVVAIIAVFAGSSMMALTGPMFERVRAEDSEAFEAGTGIFFATLVSDAHRAQEMSADTSGTITLTMAPPTTGTILYGIDEERHLTRTAPGERPAKLVGAVRELRAEQAPDSALWSVELVAGIRGYDGGATTVSRRMNLLPGAAWAGGA